MAELRVQPKKATNWWIWLLLALVAIAIIFFLSRGCNNTADSVTTGAADEQQSDSAASGTVATTTPTTNSPKLAEGDIDFNSPVSNYEEINDNDISVRGNDRYAIYSLGKNILFDVDKSSIRPDAEKKLKLITSSLDKRYAGGKVEIYGYTDSTGDADHNKKLSEDRAEAVKNWIVKNGNISASLVALHPMGETNPVSTNATEQGKQENRSVQIVARKK